MEPIKIGNYNISYLGSSFQEWFGCMLLENGVKLYFSRNFTSAETLTPNSLECPHCHKAITIEIT